MMSQWVIWLLVIEAGILSVSGNSCDTAAAGTCYLRLKHYEEDALPLFGKDEAELKNVCSNISTSFACVERYKETCEGKPVCDDECKKLIGNIISFDGKTKLRSLETELCSDSPLRRNYLDNVQCLQKHADLYVSCHNVSRRSKHYLESEAPKLNQIKLICCYFKWYDECIINVTKDHCEKNATSFVRNILQMLNTHVQKQSCVATCTSPPLPPEDSELSNDKYETTEAIGNTGKELEKSKKDETTEIIDDNIVEERNKDKKEKITGKSDNTTLGDSQAAVSKCHAVKNWILLPFLCIWMSKHIL